MSAEQQHAIVYGMGNPLLDISANVPHDMFTKYNVQAGNAYLAAPEHMPVFEEIEKNYNVEYIAGGATQNSIRVAQWMLQKPGATAYVGCVGKDHHADQLQQCAQADGVAVHYLHDEAQPTGTCAVLIDEHKERCLIANLAAANHYKAEHLDTIAQVWQNAQIYYSAGFFLTVSPAAALRVAQHSLENNKTFMMNLSAPFICQFFKEPLLQLLPYVDVIFGNETELKAFGESMGYEDLTLEAIAVKLAAHEKKGRARTVVITQGASQTLVVINGQVAHFAVPKICKGKIVDTNGAGDAFVGGYISQLAQGKSIFDCVRAGHYAAGLIIQVSGTKLSGVPDFQ